MVAGADLPALWFPVGGVFNVRPLHWPAFCRRHPALLESLRLILAHQPAHSPSINTRYFYLKRFVVSALVCCYAKTGIGLTIYGVPFHFRVCPRLSKQPWRFAVLLS
jgi:uncharacterized membrane protein